MQSIRIVMLCRDKLDLTGRAIVALARDVRGFDAELVLVDQSTEDGLELRAEKASQGRIPFRLITSGPGEAFSAAANRGATGAETDLLLFLDNDTELRPKCLSVLAGALNADEGIGIVGPKLVLANGQIDQAGLALPLWLAPIPVGRHAPENDNRFSFPRTAFAVSTSCLMVRREPFAAVHGFEEGYAWGFESADLSIAFRKRRLRTHFEPRAVCRHEAGATLNEHPDCSSVESNRARFLERWGVDLFRRVSSYLDRMVDNGAKLFYIYGTGAEARHLANTLELGGYEVGGFLSSNGIRSVGSYPAWNIRDAPRDTSGAILIGTDRVSEAEDELASAGLLGGAALPILIE